MKDVWYLHDIDMFTTDGNEAQRWLDAGKSVTNLKKKIESLECKIDSLMLEYCPEEMTDEQFENWASHQKRIYPIGLEK